MGGKRSAQVEEGVDPFVDILTCLAGVLILIIILVVIEAQDAKILIRTPMMQDIVLAPIYIEINEAGELFLVEREAIQKLVDKTLKDIGTKHKDDKMNLMLALSQEKLSYGKYRIELGYYLTGILALFPQKDAQGFKFGDNLEDENNWYAQQLSGIDNQTQMIAFIVRSDDRSYAAFKKARALAWLQEIKVAYEVMDNVEPLKFGLGGETMQIQ